MADAGADTSAGAKVDVDHDVCIVSGMCASLAPEIFDIDDDGLKLEVLQPVRFPPSWRTRPAAPRPAARWKPSR